MVSITIRETYSKLSSLRIQTSRYRKWLRAALKSSVNAALGSTFPGKKCLKSWMIRMTRSRTWSRQLKQLDRPQTSDHPPKSQTQVRSLATCLFLKTWTSTGSSSSHRSIRVAINDSTCQRILRYLSLMQMWRHLQMATHGAKRGHQSHLQQSQRTSQPTWMRWRRKSDTVPTILREITKVRWRRAVSNLEVTLRRLSSTKRWWMHVAAVEWWVSTRETTSCSVMTMTERTKKTRMLWTFRISTIAIMITWKSRWVNSSINSSSNKWPLSRREASI